MLQWQTSNGVHKPVLTKQVLQYLSPKPNENFVDATIGESGHAIEILKRNKPEGRLLGIDLDPKQIENSRLNTREFKERVTLIDDSYANLKEIVEKTNFKPINGILLDIGISSWQLELAGRGFSFKRDEILDMRYDIQNVLTAEKIINEYQEEEIEKVLKEYGEEKFSKQIAREISKQRKIKKIQSTFELKNIIEKAIPKRLLHGKIHFATRTFQALRIAVNQELGNLKKVLPEAVSVLSYGGRLVVISFHSLEDRIVKNFFNEEAKKGPIKILTKKPVIANLDEIAENPRSRSAKLRAIEKI